MGERGQVLIKDTGVYLYTHWRGYSLQENVRRALRVRLQRDSPECLAWIIFSQLIGPGGGDVASYGIGSRLHSDLNYPLVVVSCKKQTVTIKDEDGRKSLKKFSSEEFLKAKGEVSQ